MIDDKYLISENEKKHISGGFIFWNFAIGFSLIISAIVNIVSAGIGIADAASPNKNTKSSYKPNFNFSQPYFRLSKYPSRTTVGYPV